MVGGLSGSGFVWEGARGACKAPLLECGCCVGCMIFLGWVDSAMGLGVLVVLGCVGCGMEVGGGDGELGDGCGLVLI